MRGSIWKRKLLPATIIVMGMLFLSSVVPLFVTAESVSNKEQLDTTAQNAPLENENTNKSSEKEIIPSAKQLEVFPKSFDLNKHPNNAEEIKENNDAQFISHLATKEEIETMKAQIGVRDPDKNYNKIIDGCGTGLAPPTEEEWDAMIGSRIVDSVSTSRALPTSVDHSQDPCFPKVGNQGGQGSCAAWATTYYVNGYLQAKDNDWTDASTGNTNHLMSPAWTYNKVNGGTDTGSSFLDSYWVIKKVGCATLSTMPYSASDYTSWGSESAWRSAPKYRCDDWEYTDASNTEVIKTWLNEGYVLYMVLDADAYSNGLGNGDDTITSAEYYEYWTDGGCHANTIVGYDDSKSQGGETGAFKIVNSWGSDWGSRWYLEGDWGGHGYYWMTYAAVAELSFSICRMTDKIDYEPSLLGVWNLNPQGARDASITLGVGPYGNPNATKWYTWDGGSYNFPSFMCLDITEFMQYLYPENTFFLEIGSGTSSGTITSFKVELHVGEYIPGIPSQISDESPDTPKNTPCYVTVSAGGFTSYSRVSLQIHRIKAEDPIEVFGEGGADWYYHVGYSQDGSSFYWYHSSEPFKTDSDDIIVDKTYTFAITQYTVYVAIMVCEDDFWTNDDLADVSSGSYGGVDNVAGSIQPPSSGIYQGTYWGYYHLDNNALTGCDINVDGDWYKTSGDYDGNSGDENDASVWFNISDDYTPLFRSPISINSDSEFTPANGVASGNGTEADPYIIEEWDINADSSIGIDIQNTDAHFIIRNCYVHDGGSSNIGIRFFQVTNGTIDNVISYNNYYGVFLSGCLKNQITKCTFNNNYFFGVYLYNSSDNTITDCHVSNNSYSYGIYLYFSNNNQIIRCPIYDNWNGICFYNSSENNISACNVYNSSVGISLSSSSNNQITNTNIYNTFGAPSYAVYFDWSSSNSMTNCDVYNNNYNGIYLSSSSNNQITNCDLYNNNNIDIYLYSSSNNNQIYYNNLIDNTNQVYDECSNSWDNGYPIGGNYWGSYTGVDLYFGVSQDQLGSDGIGDTAYNITGGSNRDNYPLMLPVGVNRPPIIQSYTPASDTTINETESITFNITVYDFEDNVITMQWYLNESLVATGDSYTFVSDYDSAGTYTVNVTVSDGEYNVSHEWTLTVNNVNRAPIIESYSPEIDPTITEEQNQLFTVGASDPDGDILTINWYLNNSLMATGNSYTFTANYTSAGWYEVKVVVSDGSLSVNRSWILTVTNVNRAPQIISHTPSTNPTITEEENQLFTITASDPDDDPITISWYLNDTLVGTATSYTFVANYTSAGFYNVKIIVSDGSLSVNHTWILTVTNVNCAPNIVSYSPIQNPTITEEQSQLFSVAASDTDADVLTIIWYLNNSLVTTGDSYTFIANYTSARWYEVKVIVSDGNLSANHTWILTVTNVNRAPVIESYSPSTNPTITEEENQIFTILATDLDNDVLSVYWYLNDSLVATGNSYTFTANYTSSGMYELKVIVSDGNLLVNKSWILTVTNINRHPTIETIGDKIAYEGQVFDLQISATDPDNDTLTFSDNTTLFNINPATGLISFTPNYDSAGIYFINITVTDGADIVWQTFKLTIINVNRAAVINSTSPAPDPTINEGQSQTFSIDAYDPDGSIPEITWRLDDTIVGFDASYLFSANYTSSGQHVINVTVTDGEYFVYYQWILTMNNVNRAPTAVIASPAQNAKFSTSEDIYFDASGSSDPDGDILTYTWTSSIDVGIGYAKTFYGKLSAGTHTITLTVSDGTNTDYKQIVITVEPPPAPQEEPKGFIPGFNLIILIVGIGVAILLFRRRKMCF